jgi:hypothetical protein
VGVSQLAELSLGELSEAEKQLRFDRLQERLEEV